MSNVRPCREIYRPKGARMSTQASNPPTNAATSVTPNVGLTGLKESTGKVKNGDEGGVINSISNGNSSTNGSVRSSVSSNESLTFADSSCLKEQSQLQRQSNHHHNNNGNNSHRHGAFGDSHKRQSKNLSNSMVESVSRFDSQDPPAHLIGE